MKIKSIFLALALVVGMSIQLSAQTKIGYCNIEAILRLMPETQTMNQQLQTFQTKLREELGTKEQYAQGKLQEYQEKAQAGAEEAELKPLQDELVKLDEELRAKAAESEQNLLQKRATLLEPITKKIDETIKSYAEANGYTYILNTVDGSGVSIVLKGPEENNVTRAIMEKLGIKIEEEQGK